MTSEISLVPQSVKQTCVGPAPASMSMEEDHAKYYYENDSCLRDCLYRYRKSPCCCFSACGLWFCPDKYREHHYCWLCQWCCPFYKIELHERHGSSHSAGTGIVAGMIIDICNVICCGIPFCCLELEL